ncbi:TPA: NACHT domain-containing protein [Providencia alcalifaciens]
MTIKIEHQKKLESLEYEVKDFHPILKQLFSRLPNITQVEYKQGPNEKGADFVLIKRDEVLDEERYIGIICKIGKITQSNSEVDRQIDECTLFERLVQGGSKKIFLNEIWVVSNSNISSNAEDKFHRKYSNTNIRFIGGEKVAELITKYYPEFWNFNSVNFGQYFSSTLTLMSKGGDSSFFGPIGMNEYIEQRIIKETSKKHKHKPVNLYTAIQSDRFIFLEGIVGSGKSTILKQLISKLAIDIEKNESYLIPILYQYSDVVNEDCNISELIKSRLNDNNLPNDKPLVFIVDSVDEVNESLSDRLTNFTKIVNNISKLDDVKLIVTSRTMDSIQDYDIVDKMFSRFSILPLSIYQIINFVDKICNNMDITNKLKNGIEKTPLFKCIPRTPISAILLARILKDEIKELPSTMTELYSKYTEIVLGRWDTSKGLLSQTEYDVMNNILLELSAFMMNNSLTCVSISEVRDIYQNYIEKRKINIDEDKLFNRLIYKNEVAFINENTKTFSFIHRSFMEYFYAEFMRKNNSCSINEEIYEVYWANSYFFYFGLLRDSEETLTRLNNIKVSSDRTRFLKLFFNGSFLLAAYLTPYNKIKEGIYDAFIEAGKLLEDTLNGNTDTPLSNLTPMSLLCIFTKCLNNNYSYDFFREALEYSSLTISESKEVGMYINYAKYFISSCLNELGDSEAFDELILNKDLNILITLGVRHAILDSNNTSKSVDKFIKRHFKTVKKNKVMKDYIFSLYDKSTQELIKNEKIDMNR